MKAVVTTGHGGYDRLSYRDVPVPVVAAGEVLIRVAAAAVNNTDINTRLGWYSADVVEATTGWRTPPAARWRPPPAAAGKAPHRFRSSRAPTAAAKSWKPELGLQTHASASAFWCGPACGFTASTTWKPDGWRPISTAPLRSS
jgi:hypothetical protein